MKLVLIFCLLSPAAWAQDPTQSQSAPGVQVDASSIQPTLQEQQKYMSDMISQMEQAQEKIKVFQNILKHVDGPLLQAVTRVVGNEEIQNSATQLFEKKKWKKFGLLQLMVFVVLILFKTWRASEAKGYLAKLWVSIYCFALYMGAALYVVPTIIFGTGYGQFLLEIYRVAQATPAA